MITLLHSRPIRQAAKPCARRTDDRGQIFGALWNVCRNAIDLRPRDTDTARAFFERNFQPRSHRAPGRRRGPSDRLFRARCCRLPLSQSRIPCLDSGIFEFALIAGPQADMGQPGEPESPRRRRRYVDDAAAHERTAVVDRHYD